MTVKIVKVSGGAAGFKEILKSASEQFEAKGLKRCTAKDAGDLKFLENVINTLRAPAGQK